MQEIYALANGLKGLRVLQLNSTMSGGGVAELLNSLVPLEVDCGLDVEWRILCPDAAFFQVTKGFHNALQGQSWFLSPDGQEVYLQRNHHCAAMMSPCDYDVVIVHDPQPAAIIPHFLGDRRPKWVWRCHIDSSPSRSRDLDSSPGARCLP